MSGSILGRSQEYKWSLYIPGIKIITNAGGINTTSCVNALKEVCSKQGVDLKIAAVCGDNLMPKLDDLQESGNIKEMSTGMELPMLTHSMTAYYGAGPIVKALQGQLLKCLWEMGWATLSYALI